jgi:hypothetical protein
MAAGLMARSCGPMAASPEGRGVRLAVGNKPSFKDIQKEIGTNVIITGACRLNALS